MPLTENQAKNAKPLERAYKLADSEGLFLLVQPNGAKLWRMKYRFAGKEKLLSFGAYPALGIAAAREKRRAAKAVLAEGKDPMLAKGQVTSDGGDTFFAVANRWHENRKSALDPAHADRVWSRMERDVFPHIGQRPIQEIIIRVSGVRVPPPLPNITINTDSCDCAHPSQNPLKS
jgi:hypothetical protein